MLQQAAGRLCADCLGLLVEHSYLWNAVIIVWPQFTLQLVKNNGSHRNIVLQSHNNLDRADPLISWLSLINADLIFVTFNYKRAARDNTHNTLFNSNLNVLSLLTWELHLHNYLKWGLFNKKNIWKKVAKGECCIYYVIITEWQPMFMD